MSDHFITLIPTNPYSVPPDASFRDAQKLFATFMPNAEEIDGRLTQEVAFIDQGENFERVLCPNCHKELTIVWWQQAMRASHETRFQNLEVLTPCCTYRTSLNDLEYHWPSGFARCFLRARGPRQKEIPQHQIRQLESILGITLRQIWTRY